MTAISFRTSVSGSKTDYLSIAIVHNLFKTMHWLLWFSVSLIALKFFNALVSPINRSHLQFIGANNRVEHCNWAVVVDCEDNSLIDIRNVTVRTYSCNSCSCAVSLPEDSSVKILTNENISQTVYDACQNQAACNATLPEPTYGSTKHVTNVTVSYDCTDLQTTTTTTSGSTETSSPGQASTSTINDHYTVISTQSSSISSSVAAAEQINTTTETGNEKHTTQSTVASTNTASIDGRSESSASSSSTSIENGSGTSPWDTISGQPGPSENRKGQRKQTALLTAISASVPAIFLLAVITITVIICIRRKRRGQYPDDKTAVLSASRNASTTDSSDDDNVESHPDPAGTSHNNNTYDQNGGYIPGDYSEIEITGDTNDSSEYNTIDLKTFKVVIADQTYNHIGISSSLGAMSASSNGGPRMAQDPDGSYATCGETETVLVDNEYSHTSKMFPENERSNTGPSNYDHVNSFRGGTGIVADDDTYSHIVADKEDIRCKTILQDVDNYSHVSHVAKTNEGSESQWQMLVGDDNAGSSSEGAQALQAVCEIERDDNPGVGKTSDSETDSHSYFILEKQFS